MRATHSFPPSYDSESRVLILGSFPSVASRKEGFYYAHKSNRFWPIMESLFSVSLKSIEDKKVFLHEHHIALWDVVSECEIDSSSDASIRSVVKRYNDEKIWRNAIRLPSTSSANASFSLSRLLECWIQVKTSSELSSG